MRVGEKCVGKEKARFERIFAKTLQNVDYEMNAFNLEHF